MRRGASYNIRLTSVAVTFFLLTSMVERILNALIFTKVLRMSYDYGFDLDFIIFSLVALQGLSGQPLSGPDIGGFAGNATPRLFGRWMGIGAMFPFCRGHSETSTADHEPWSFGEEVFPNLNILYLLCWSSFQGFNIYEKDHFCLEDLSLMT